MCAWVCTSSGWRGLRGPEPCMPSLLYYPPSALKPLLQKVTAMLPNPGVSFQFGGQSVVSPSLSCLVSSPGHSLSRLLPWKKNLSLAFSIPLSGPPVLLSLPLLCPCWKLTYPGLCPCLLWTLVPCLSPFSVTTLNTISLLMTHWFEYPAQTAFWTLDLYAKCLTPHLH